MVSEQTCVITTNKIYSEPIKIDDSHIWISNGDAKMPSSDYFNDERKTKEQKSEDVASYIKELLNEVCDKAMEISDNIPSVVIRYQSDQSPDEKLVKNFNRRTSIVDKEFRNSLGVVEARNEYINVRRAVSESILQDNDLKDFRDETVKCDNVELPKHFSKHSFKDCKDKANKEKKKKKLSFTSIFGKKEKQKAKETKEEEETHDNLPQLPVFHSNTLGKSKKYFSSLELHQQKNELHRKPSFIKKLVHISEDSSNFLKRSLSFRDNKKPQKDFSRERLTEKKTQEWRQSLQSLVESDISVSYNDLSFIDYDALNDINYETVKLRPGKPDRGSSYIGRTQSMIEKVSIAETSKENMQLLCFV